MVPPPAPGAPGLIRLNRSRFGLRFGG